MSLTGKRAGALLFLALAVLLVAANRAAYNGYFQADDLANLGWTSQVRLPSYFGSLLWPFFYPYNFRPAGHLFYVLLSRTAKLQFGWYVGAMHVLHLMAVWLLWRLLRRLNTRPLAAAAGTLFFAFHFAVFDIFWRPAFVFDLLCAVFCLASLLAYTHNRWIASFLFLWLAYKAKEQAVMLPAVLACYELWFGQRNWKRLIPFFCFSLWFGLQGLLLNPHVAGDYAFRFSAGALGETVPFYSAALMKLPLLILALAALPALVRDRRVWLGLCALLLFLAPLMFLPGRMFSVYLYVPLVGLAVACAAAAERLHPAAVGALCLAWLPFNYAQLRVYRNPVIEEGRDNRAFVTALAAYARSSPDTSEFLYEILPRKLPAWGVEGALRFVYGHDRLAVRSAEEYRAGRRPWPDAAAFLGWDPGQRKLFVLKPSENREAPPFIRMSGQTPVWRLGEGWYELEHGYRWMADRATARLKRPPSATHFELTVNVGTEQLSKVHRIVVETYLNGELLGRAEFTREGWQTARWEVPSRISGDVLVEFRVPAESQLARGARGRLGAAIMSFGFARAEAGSTPPQ